MYIEPTKVKNNLLQYYEANETKVDVGFFIFGFLFDILTLSDFDDWFSLTQQLIYLAVIGFILLADLQLLHLPGAEHTEQRGRSITAWFHARDYFKKTWFERLWGVRHAILHFLLGSLLSVYALYYIKSASFIASSIFILVIVFLMIANEIKFFQGLTDIKIILFVICLFSFFSTLVPVAIGFVGLVPFLLSLFLTGLVLFLMGRSLVFTQTELKAIRRNWLLPCGAALFMFVVFYIGGVIPPIPLSVKSMGVYHAIEKQNGNYILLHEKPWYKFWHHDDSDFLAEANDKIYFFVKIYSPARFDDSVILHWYYKDPKQGWLTSDKIPMRISGGRKEGYRGFSVKQNYTAGDWRVSVETTDGREIGRHYFEVTKSLAVTPDRQFNKVIQ